MAHEPGPLSRQVAQRALLNVHGERIVDPGCHAGRDVVDDRLLRPADNGLLVRDLLAQPRDVVRPQEREANTVLDPVLAVDQTEVVAEAGDEERILVEVVSRGAWRARTRTPRPAMSG